MNYEFKPANDCVEFNKFYESKSNSDLIKSLSDPNSDYKSIIEILYSRGFDEDLLAML